jgi:hypothetical protein
MDNEYEQQDWEEGSDRQGWKNNVKFKDDDKRYSKEVR